ncbi:hypothetical protein T11_5912 [Trichinella zimbabwensis]|uniref:Uncharacterized protein n=1 Tax=Trichinella zimbabwensis TaxID=268475 RepID=A0A0V1HAE2_9BILA|nr:hypothetical protein T11_5912 [Trichinella zimbabwensis]
MQKVLQLHHFIHGREIEDEANKRCSWFISIHQNLTMCDDLGTRVDDMESWGRDAELATPMSADRRTLEKTNKDSSELYKSKQEFEKREH